MKATFLISFLASLFLFTNSSIQAQSKTPAPGKPADEQVTTMLKDFYTNYITTIAISKENIEAKLDLLKKKHCTPKLLKKIEKDFEEGLDYDPYINAQDADTACLKTLSIQKDPKKPNKYAVSYMDNYTHKKITINLLVIKQNEGFRIDSIL